MSKDNLGSAILQTEENTDVQFDYMCFAFFSGTKFYYVKKPSGNLVAKAGSAIWTALKVEQIIMEILFIISIFLEDAGLDNSERNN